MYLGIEHYKLALVPAKLLFQYFACWFAAACYMSYSVRGLAEAAIILASYNLWLQCRMLVSCDNFINWGMWLIYIVPNSRIDK